MRLFVHRRQPIGQLGLLCCFALVCALQRPLQLLHLLGLGRLRCVPVSSQHSHGLRLLLLVRRHLLQLSATGVQLALQAGHAIRQRLCVRGVGLGGTFVGVISLREPALTGLKFRFQVSHLLTQPIHQRFGVLLVLPHRLQFGGYFLDPLVTLLAGSTRLLLRLNQASFQFRHLSHRPDAFGVNSLALLHGFPQLLLELHHGLLRRLELFVCAAEVRCTLLSRLGLDAHGCQLSL
mmetsp:Transcript_20367/g.38983  ORF Transcript_20367/g.38983 Transcript_20367/m.38983 type:complete len:235 (+) Transcript_20367:2493-3197(+)